MLHICLEFIKEQIGRISDVKMMAAKEHISAQECEINGLKAFSAAVNLFTQERQH